MVPLLLLLLFGLRPAPYVCCSGAVSTFALRLVGTDVTKKNNAGGRVLRKTASSPGAAAAVHELVGKGVQSVQVELSANERSELSVTFEAPHRPFNHSEDCPSSHRCVCVSMYTTVAFRGETYVIRWGCQRICTRTHANTTTHASTRRGTDTHEHTHTLSLPHTHKYTYMRYTLTTYRHAHPCALRSRASFALRSTQTDSKQTLWLLHTLAVSDTSGKIPYIYISRLFIQTAAQRCLAPSPTIIVYTYLSCVWVHQELTPRLIQYCCGELTLWLPRELKWRHLSHPWLRVTADPLHGRRRLGIK